MSERPARHHIGHRVRANWGADGGVRAEGWMVAHSIGPVVTVVADDGQVVEWRDVLCEVIGPEDVPAMVAATQARDERVARIAAAEAEVERLRATVERVEALAAALAQSSTYYERRTAGALRAALAPQDAQNGPQDGEQGSGGTGGQR